MCLTMLFKSAISAEGQMLFGVVFYHLICGFGTQSIGRKSQESTGGIITYSQQHTHTFHAFFS